MNNRKKIALIGAGQIGGTAALLTGLRNLGDIVLYDVVEGMPQGKALDLSHLAPVFDCDFSIIGTNEIADIESADVCLVTSGLARKPGMSRDDLLAANSKIIREVGSGIKEYAPKALVIVVTNPLDIMTALMQQVTGCPQKMVVGMAGVLDSARYRSFLSAELQISNASISAFVMGGHGDSMVPVRSYTTAGGVPIDKLLDSELLDKIETRVRQAGGEIVGLLKTGSAFCSPAAAAVQMIEAFLFDQKKVFSASVALNGEYGFEDIYLGVPIIMGAQGVERVLEIDLSEEEKEALKASAAAVKTQLQKLSL